MTRFQAAYAEWRKAFRLATHARDLEYRANMLYRLWERPDDPKAIALGRRLRSRLDQAKAAEHAAEDAEDYLDRVWNGYSHFLRPIGPHGHTTSIAVIDRGVWP